MEKTQKYTTDTTPSKHNKLLPLIKVYKPRENLEFSPKDSNRYLQSIKIITTKEKEPTIKKSLISLRGGNISASHIIGKSLQQFSEYFVNTPVNSQNRGAISSLKKIQSEQTDLRKDPEDYGLVLTPASKSRVKVLNCSNFKMENDFIIEEFTEEEPFPFSKPKESIFGDISIESLDKREEQELEKEKSEFLSNIEAEMQKRKIVSNNMILQTPSLQQSHKLLQDIKENPQEYQFNSVLENDLTCRNSKSILMKLEKIRKKLIDVKQEINEVEKELNNRNSVVFSSKIQKTSSCLNISVKSIKCPCLSRIGSGINITNKDKELLKCKMGSYKNDRRLVQAHSPLLLSQPYNSLNVSAIKSSSRYTLKAGSSLIKS